jgi:phosphoglycerol transferase MdoB-like AlkP superfamily enzyme
MSTKPAAWPLVGRSLSHPVAAQCAPPNRSAAVLPLRVLSVFEWFRVLLALIVIPNVITCVTFMALSQFFRGWIDIEILILAALYVWLPSRIVLGFITIDVLFDLFEPVARIYYFAPADALGAFKYLGLLPYPTLAAYAGCVFAYLALIAGSIYLLLPRKGWATPRLSLVLIGIAVVALGSDICRGRYISQHADTIKGRAHLVRLPAAVLAYNLVQRTRLAEYGSRTRPDIAVESASKETLAEYRPAILQGRTNVVLVLLESWGEFHDSAAGAQMLKAYETPGLSKRYRLETGSVPFFGSTIEGESRELCGHTFSHGLPSASTDELRTCLPALLREHGYVTIGIHGFEPRMYARERWYPRIGFGTDLFRPDLASMGMKTCQGGLIGTCDSDVVGFVGRRLLQAGPANPVFIHWATLNSHLPIDKEGPESDHCKAGSSEEQTLCIWSRLVQNVHRGIAQIASAERLSATVFIVVGDHAPPFGAQSLRSRFSQEEVPFVALIPRELEKSRSP